MEYRTVKELCSIVADCPHSSPVWTSSGKIVIRNNNIKNGRISFASPSYTDDEHFSLRIRRVVPQTEDIVITREAPIGDVGMIPAGIECCLGQRQVLLRADADVCDPHYLLYALQTPFAHHQMSWSEGTGTTVSNLRIPHLEKIQIPYLPIPLQCKIATVLHSIEERIFLNEQINDNLAALLQLLYQQQFDIAKQPKMCGSLSEICEYAKERVPISNLTLDNYFSTENMLPNKAGAVAASALPTTMQTTKCHAGDVLVSNIRPYFKKIIYCTADCGCSTDVLCFSPKSSALSAYLFSTLYADRFFDFMVAGSKGTKMPRGDKQQIMTYIVRLPSDTDLAAFNEVAQPILAKIESNRAENVRLSSLRATLLPRLMSGEIDVSKVKI